MPGYGITPSGDSEGVLPWSWAVERLTKAHNYWVATGGRGAAPQLTAVWGVWLDGAFYFSFAATSRKARNLAEDARCAISTERADEAVIVEGIAELVAGKALLERIQDAEVNLEVHLGETHQLALAQDLDIAPDHVERQEFGVLVDPTRRRFDARLLAVDGGVGLEAIEDALLQRERSLLPGQGQV